MAEPGLKDTISHAFVEGPRGPRASADSEQAAARIRMEAEKKNAEEGLKVTGLTEPTKEALKIAAEDAIGRGRKANGERNRSGGEVTRKADADRAIDLAVDYVDRGYDALPGAQKSHVRAAFIDRAKTIPALSERLATAGISTNEFAEKILRDPSLRQAVKDVLSGIADADIPEEIVSVLEAEKKALTDKKTELTAEKTTTDTELGNVDTALQDYNAGTIVPGALGGGGTPGAEYTAMATLRSEISSHTRNSEVLRSIALGHQSQLQGLQQELRDAQRRRGGASRHRPEMDIQADIRAAQADLTMAEARYSSEAVQLETKTVELQIKIDREAQLRAKQAELKARSKQLKGEIDETTTKESAKETEFREARAKREQYERQFVQSLDGVFADATDAYFGHQVDLMVNEFHQDMEKFVAAEKNQREQRILDSIRQRHFRDMRGPSIGGGLRRRGMRVNVSQVREDYQELMQNGPDQVVRSIIDGAIRQEFPIAHRHGAEADTAVREAIADTAIVDKVRQQFLESTTKLYITTGGFLRHHGSVNPDEVRMLQTTDWGRGMIEKGLEGRQADFEQINKLVGEEVITPGGRLTEWFSKLSWPMVALLSLLTFGGLKVGGLGAAVSIGRT